jgi:hypothetical protein
MRRFLAQPPLRAPATQTVRHCPVPDFPRLHQQALDLSHTHPQFRRRRRLRDQSLLRLLEHYQPVSVPLGHEEFSCFEHLPSLSLLRRHFYLAQTRHSHWAPTSSDFPLDTVWSR